MNQIRTIKGTHDILPENSKKWQRLEKIIHNNASLYGYEEIRTPIIEEAGLFNRGIGQDTDIVSKEMYSWVDRDKKNIALRPEMTASVVRSFIQHSLGSQSSLQRLYYMGPSFRRERPQKGRQRQFHQFGVEAIGSKNPEQDTEVIALGWDILSKTGINNLELRLSSIGSEDCRNRYRNALVKFLKPYTLQLSEVSQQRLKNNPLRILDTKNKDEIDIIKSAPIIEEFYTKEDRNHFAQVKDYLKSIDIPFSLDPLLVRGLDYYTQTTFEIISNDIGAQDALLGGGRYDGLIESLGGKDTPAVGFAAGMERILLAIDGLEEKENMKKIIYMVCVEKDALGAVQQIAKELRKLDINVVLETLRRSIKAQMREANKCDADYAIIIGEEEHNQKTVQVKNLNDGNQKTINQTDLFNYFKSLTF
ncbi:MAG: histidine--tRNA ligase [Candidatus Neomarinimicrobiota bacterium]|nr:histidine--tRNA ligase [Candidatus Neomarinimicrobiota bacterium]